MTRVSNHFNFHNTDDSDIVANDLRDGKYAYGPDGPITGTLGGNMGIVMAYFPPVGVAGAYTFDGSHMLVATGPGTYSSMNDIDADGRIYSSNTYASMIAKHVNAKPPAFTSTARVYTFWFHWINSSTFPSTGTGARIIFNLKDGAFTDYWFVGCTWTGTAWRLGITEVTASAGFSRGSADMSTIVDTPFMGCLQVIDSGDSINAFLTGFETDNTTDDDSLHVRYSIASRPHKSELYYNVGLLDQPGTDMRCRGAMIMDI